MNRQDVERTITQYLNPIFGFALKRCKSIHDAEDLSQELQFLFQSDGFFLLHCITTLLKNGKLKEPTEGQRKTLATLIVNN